MIDILITGGGDLIPTENGDIALVENNDNDIIQSANNNILTRLGENMYHPTIGNGMYGKRLKYNNNGLRMVETYCRDAIMQDSRIKAVESIIAERAEDSDHDCTIKYAVRTLSDDILYNTVNTSVWM